MKTKKWVGYDGDGNWIKIKETVTESPPESTYTINGMSVSPILFFPIIIFVVCLGILLLPSIVGGRK
jgi:hypothetical protein